MKTRILVVDDEVIVAESTRSMLRELGYSDIDVVLSGDESLEAIARQRPDIVLMDINLAGGREGVAVADVIRQQHDLPVVFVTAYADPSTLALARVVQPFGYVVKPFEARDLHVAVEIGLFNHQVARQLKQRERELRRTSERLELSLRATDAALWEWNVQSGHTVFSDRWAEIVGTTLDALAPISIQTWIDLCHPQDLEESNALLAEYFSRERGSYDCECRMRHRDGGWVWVLTRGKVVEWTPDGRPLLMIGTHQDITQHKLHEAHRLELERRMLRSQTLHSLGVLAGGIAHTFNNLLTVVLGQASMLREQFPPGSVEENGLRDIEEAAERGAVLSRAMLAYSGRGQFVVGPFSLAAVVEDMATLLRASLPGTVTLRLDLVADLPPMCGDAAQVRQTLTHLVTNAVEAIGPTVGLVTIAAGATDCTADQLSSFAVNEGAAAGRYQYLEVSDTGKGMAADTIEHMFEPFFTTKFTGRGLGLPAVHGIVRGHRGAIDIRSQMGDGTTVRVLFPVGDRAERVAD